MPSDTNENISILPAAAVTVGAEPPAHKTLVNVAVPLPVVAAWFKTNKKLFPDEAVGIVKVQAVDAVRVAVCNVPLVKSKVWLVVTVPMATVPSV